ncbi:MAG: trypsin-like serine protease [Hellea sp.]|nr:trypsin-like serine protease [Hellea sp.]
MINRSVKTAQLVKTLMLASALTCFAAPSLAQSQLNSNNSIADLVETVSPAVVNIVVTTDDGQTTSEGQGSGFVISTDGEIVTNYHVIEGGDSISVVFNNSENFYAQIVGTDEETDLALLKVNGNSSFPAVRWYEGNPIRVGDWVIAIGNPFGIGQSTSLGIISAIGRDRVESGAYVDYIQTDATINRGNSGGPLFNPEGEVIGVNSAIFSPTGASVGIGFSIPHQTARNVIDAIRKDGRVRRGWLGAGLRDAEFSGSKQYTGGANVNNVIAGSPAHLAGLQIDDIIFNIDGQSVTGATQATRLIGDLGPDARVTMMIERNEQPMSITLQMAERPSKEEVDRAMAEGTYSAPASPSAPRYESAPQSSPAPALPPGSASNLSATGLMLVDLSSAFRQSIGMRYDQVGVYVEGIVPGSTAASIGLTANMVILEMEQEPVPSVRHLSAMMQVAAESGQREVLLLVRLEDGSENYAVLPLTDYFAGRAVYNPD